MNNQIVIGALAGLLLGVVEFFAFGEGSMYLYIVLPVILGALIGFAGTQQLKINSYLLGALVGALFFIILGANRGGALTSYFDEVITGAVTGAALAFLIPFISKQLNK